MKVFILIGFMGLVLNGCYPNIKTSQNKAEKLFVELECNDEPTGSGFPIGPNLIMTAKHVGCVGPEIPSVSLDSGKTWMIEKNWSFNSDNDIAVIETKETLFNEWAKFRQPELGEVVSGYGFGYGGVLSFGIISQIEPEHYFSTSIPISGVSGSALVGQNGDVIGILIHGAPDTYVGGTLSGGYPGGFLETIKKSFLLHQELVKWKESRD
jgi:S1-C subfamily serine protease